MATSCITLRRSIRISEPDYATSARIHRIVVQEDDALRFACNAVNIGEVIILNESSAVLAEQLRQAGFSVVENELSEFMKAGGSASV